MLYPIFVQPICIIFLLWHKYSAPLQYRCNWCQPPLPTTCRLSRANGGALVPAPANVGPYIPPPYHPRPFWSIRPIQPVAIQFYRTSQWIKASYYEPTQDRYIHDPSDTIQPIRSRKFSQYDPVSVSSKGCPPTIPSQIIKTHTQLPQLLILHPPQRPLPQEISSLPLMLHLLLPSLIWIEIYLLIIT